MNKAKSIYISLYSTLLFLGVFLSLRALFTQAFDLTWLGAVVALLPTAYMFGTLMTFRVARTSSNLPIQIYAALIGGVTSTVGFLFFEGSALALFFGVGIGVIGFLLYDFWYSRFTRSSNTVLQLGNRLPSFELKDTQLGPVNSASFIGKPTLMIFFRGNWCPLCMAQLKEVAGQYKEIAEKGVEVALISPQPEANTQKLAKKFDVPYRFLTDEGNKVARQLGIMNEDGTPAGLGLMGYESETVLPTVLLTNAAGELVYIDMTDNYRVRPEPDQFLKIIEEKGVAV
ncbi:MAG: redoxin domain-containing protein [Pseudomonadales bacterium]|nr:redoxin domain-containing protein [Pseudomonadales bacterium]